MQIYKELVADVLHNGKLVNTGKGRTKRIIGAMVRYDVGTKLPAVTGKKTNIRWALIETAMFIKGEHHTDFLKQYGAEKIWEKQALSEDYTIRRPVPPEDILNKLIEKDSRPEAEVRQEFQDRIIAYQQKTMEVGQKFQVKEGETLDEAGFKAAMDEITAEFENWFTDQGIELYFDKVIKTKGEMGPTYGAQWRKWLGVNPSNNSLVHIDQLKEILWKLENIPDSRQIILTAWNPAVIARETIPYDTKIKAGYMGQPPCHLTTQFLTDTDENGHRTLNAVLFIRSNDLALGHPFNIVGYAALLHLIAAKFGWSVGELVVQIGDAHIYENHLEGMKTYLYDRAIHETPTFKLAPGVDIDNFTVEDLLAAVGDYQHEPYMPFEINV